MPHNHGHGWAAKLRTGGCKLSAKPSLPATLKSEALSFGACCTPYYPVLAVLVLQAPWAPCHLAHRDWHGSAAATSRIPTLRSIGAQKA